MHWYGQSGLGFGRVWMYLGAHFYWMASILILCSIPTNLAALIEPARILAAFHIDADPNSLWFRYIRVRAIVALCLIAAFAYSLISHRALHVMTYVTVGYLLLYLAIDLFTVIRFGEMSSTVWMLLSARLLVAVLVCISVEHYMQIEQDRLRIRTGVRVG